MMLQSFTHIVKSPQESLNSSEMLASQPIEEMPLPEALIQCPHTWNQDGNGPANIITSLAFLMSATATLITAIKGWRK